MSEQAIDYPIALAALAYSRSLIPNKAACEKATFDNKVREVRERPTPLAVTEMQKDLLVVNMVALQRVYIV